ncbi:hypothetical protein [Tenacibaculum singaporense]|uniref:hypothetical protein n=1 Tax=Tenacibaculum singaporense TaxID=2358479 RepID=UPI000F674C06|nr:hypothetical protein [Tenacibaculum singaporense]RSC92062.1 hypothetical protein EI424_14860 [Tenacibaculum singaporense]
MENEILHFLKKSSFILFLVFFSSLRITSQNPKKDNRDAIDKIKTHLSKKQIESKIIGYWKFKKMTDSIGNPIDENEIRPNVVFNKDMSYFIIDNMRDTLDKGVWHYDNKERQLKLIYDEPKYNVPIKQLSPKLIKKLKENNRLIKSESFFWEINKVNKNELILIEHKPHNEFELKYNLRVYKKDNKKHVKIRNKNR